MTDKMEQTESNTETKPAIPALLDELWEKHSHKANGYLGTTITTIGRCGFNAAIREALKPRHDREMQLSSWLNDASYCLGCVDLDRVANAAREIQAEIARLRTELEESQRERDALKREVKDLREDVKWSDVERSRNADKFSREGY